MTLSFSCLYCNLFNFVDQVFVDVNLLVFLLFYVSSVSLADITYHIVLCLCTFLSIFLSFFYFLEILNAMRDGMIFNCGA